MAAPRSGGRRGSEVDGRVGRCCKSGLRRAVAGSLLGRDLDLACAVRMVDSRRTQLNYP